ncbi:MAG: class I SAM-dependent methyltransferase [Rhodocyclales bacterium]|nr:class I SAM-dependent methyltransferase [Rhodocyclales bacterium]
MHTTEPSLAGIVDAITEANLHGLLRNEKQSPDSGVLTGYSGNKVVGVLQRLARLFVSDATACYLEIGVFQGLTLNSVAYATPTLACFGIDNFAFFDPGKKNLSIVTQRIEALGNSNAHLINADFEDALDNLGAWIGDRKIAVYFVDGPHDYRSQLMCLEFALPYLHERAVIVIDDSNYEHVRQANADFLRTHPDWFLIAQAYTSSHPDNMSAEEGSSAKNGWWNGVNILVRNQKDLGTRIYPPTRRSRSAFEADHLVHPHRMASLVGDSLRLTNEIANKAPLAFARRLLRMVRKISSIRPRLAKFDSMNTNSRELPEFIISKIGQ